MGWIARNGGGRERWRGYVLGALGVALGVEAYWECTVYIGIPARGEEVDGFQLVMVSFSPIIFLFLFCF